MKYNVLQMSEQDALKIEGSTQIEKYKQFRIFTTLLGHREDKNGFFPYHSSHTAHRMHITETVYISYYRHCVQFD